MKKANLTLRADHRRHQLAIHGTCLDPLPYRVIAVSTTGPGRYVCSVGPGTPGHAAPTLWRAPVVTTRMEGGKDDVMTMTNHAHLQPTRTPATPPGLLPLPTSAEDRTRHARLPQYTVRWVYRLGWRPWKNRRTLRWIGQTTHRRYNVTYQPISVRSAI
jgi:hypothetical protein